MAFGVFLWTWGCAVPLGHFGRLEPTKPANDLAIPIAFDRRLLLCCCTAVLLLYSIIHCYLTRYLVDRKYPQTANQGTRSLVLVYTDMVHCGVSYSNTIILANEEIPAPPASHKTYMQSTSEVRHSPYAVQDREEAGLERVPEHGPPALGHPPQALHPG